MPLNTIEDAIAVRQAIRAAGGSSKSFEVVRDTLGQDPKREDANMIDPEQLEKRHAEILQILANPVEVAKIEEV